jgi:hypothetical protein
MSVIPLYFGVVWDQSQQSGNVVPIASDESGLISVRA